VIIPEEDCYAGRSIFLFYLAQKKERKKEDKQLLTPAVNFDSRKFRGHPRSSASSIGGDGGLQRTK